MKESERRVRARAGCHRNSLSWSLMLKAAEAEDISTTLHAIETITSGAIPTERKSSWHSVSGTSGERREGKGGGGQGGWVEGLGIREKGARREGKRV